MGWAGAGGGAVAGTESDFLGSLGAKPYGASGGSWDTLGALWVHFGHRK